MATPTLDKLLTGISGILRSKDGPKLNDFLILEPPFPQVYQDLIQELRKTFPSPTQSAALDKKVTAGVVNYGYDEGDPTNSSSSFNRFLVAYLEFIRGVETNNPSANFEQLLKLLRYLSPALGDSSIGIVMLQTAVSYCRSMSTFTRQLEKVPQLTSALIAKHSANSDVPVTLASLAVEVMQKIFDQCGGTPRTDDKAPPGGLRIGLYAIANVCFPLCLRKGSLDTLENMILSINSKSPPLSGYPAAHRVTYLYYLGRFWFAYNHFVQARAAFDAAYTQTPAKFVRQRSRILTYLLVSSILLGRFPSMTLIQRPEAAELAPHFGRLCKAIRQGDIPTFRSIVDVDSRDPADAATARFFHRHRMLLQIQKSGEVLVSRTLFRRVFVIDGAQALERAAANFDLRVLRGIIVQLEKRGALLSPNSPYKPKVLDPSFKGAEEYFETYANPYASSDREEPSLAEVEALAASFAYQGLIHGYIKHPVCKVVLTGTTKAGVNQAEIGFPKVWEIISRRADLEKAGRARPVPGWIEG